MICEDAVESWADEIRKKIPARIRRLIAMVSYDIWYGPLPVGYTEETGFGRKGNTKYPGFQSACRQIREVLDRIDELSNDIWIDYNCGEVLLSEPQGYWDEGEWSEPWWGDIRRMERREMLSYIVDKEIVPYVS